MKTLKKYVDKLEFSFPLYPITFLVIIGFLLYFRSLFNGFVQDDEWQILVNPLVHSLSNIPTMFATSTFENGQGIYYKPLMPITYSLIYSVFGAQAWVFHLFDLALHICNSILLFIFFKKFFAITKIKYVQTISFFLALIFLVHPVQVESVAYIASTQELLVVFFLLAALILTIDYCHSKYSLRRIILICVFVLCSLLGKETGILTVILVPSLCLVYKKINKITISFGLVPLLIYGFLRFKVAAILLSQQNSIVVSPIARAPLIVRLFTLPYELASYTRLIIFPKDLYASQRDIISGFSDPRFYFSLVVVIMVAIILVSLFFKYKSRYLAFFFFWIIIGFAMLSNIIPLDGTVAERWVYVPIIGVLGFAGLVIAKLINYQKFVWLMVVVALIFIPLAMIRTYVRIGNWYSNYTLGAHDVLYENSAPMDNDYASALIKLGNVKESLKYLKKAVALEPNYLQIRANLGLVLAADGQISASKKLFYDMLQNKNNINSYDNIALFFYQVEKDPDIIISFLKKPLALSPQNITLNQLMATAYFEKGATASALFYANRAYKLDPSQANLQLLKEIKK